MVDRQRAGNDYPLQTFKQLKGAKAMKKDKKGITLTINGTEHGWNALLELPSGKLIFGDAYYSVIDTYGYKAFQAIEQAVLRQARKRWFRTIKVAGLVVTWKPETEQNYIERTGA
jgi:hypothetical protein